MIIESWQHKSADSIICPYCGHDNGHDNESSDEYEEECGGCEREFSVSVDYSISFSTSKFDRAKEDAERRARLEHHQRDLAESKAACSKFTPGMRVRVKETSAGRYRIFSPGLGGRTGTVDNRELGVMVYVNLDPSEGESPSGYANSFHARELEEIA